MNNKNYYSLFFSYGISFAVIGLSYIVYSKILTPGEFGLYSIALSIASFGIFILEGGIKTAIIKHSESFTDVEQSTALSWLLLVSIVLSLLLIFAKYPLGLYFPVLKDDYLFLSLFTITYLLTYPFIVISTAFLERKLNYQRLSWIESVSNTIERGGPVVFLVWTELGIYSFVIALLLGRLIRVAAVSASHPVKIRLPNLEHLRSILPLMREGGWLQLATGMSLIRDNLHTIILGILWGKAWVGYYSWGLQLCMVLSQAFVQVSARVSLPRMAQQVSFSERWETCLVQIRFLVIFTAPLLITSLLVIPGINSSFFGGKWAPILPLLPLLFLRMIIGMAITPVGTLLPVQCGGMVFARVSSFWTLLEVVGSSLLILLIGPPGLALNYAITVFLGLYICVRALGETCTGDKYIQIMKIIWFRPSLLISLCGTFMIVMIPLLSKENISVFLVKHFYSISGAAISMVVCAYLSERDLRNNIGKLLQNEETL
jgi:O-antigen/teichoic acid export membrane protein